MTKEQWENAARFAGLEFTGMVDANTPCVKRPPELRPNEIWMPHEDWRDFGPLLVLLLRWRKNKPARLQRAVATSMYMFNSALDEGTHDQLMRTGCELAAAIGATMKGETHEQ